MGYLQQYPGYNLEIIGHSMVSCSIQFTRAAGSNTYVLDIPLTRGGCVHVPRRFLSAAEAHVAV
jgi:hypothetical protein